MTPPFGFEPTHFHLTTAPSPDEGVLILEAHGFLDHGCAECFLAAATEHLEGTPGLHALHLDCSDLDGLDSMGLAMLLMLHRRTTAAHVTLYLDARPPALDRMLDITGTLDHLVPHHAVTTSGHAEPHRMAYRHTSEDGIPLDRAGQGHRPSGSDSSG
ncbi:STAS domain-containing protein [Streptomyces sp. NBC_00328]|uniref:STAS domain-containing protein n=1 Tax=Streptomyces sp. NBC_00328 TaxID=2903646 RepID=UPI002E2C6736|nr:STAS domain-containing protein [Streptomyces sp. NBC_00328]